MMQIQQSQLPADRPQCDAVCPAALSGAALTDQPALNGDDKLEPARLSSLGSGPIVLPAQPKLEPKIS